MNEIPEVSLVLELFKEITRTDVFGKDEEFIKDEIIRDYIHPFLETHVLYRDFVLPFHLLPM